MGTTISRLSQPEYPTFETLARREVNDHHEPQNASERATPISTPLSEVGLRDLPFFFAARSTHAPPIALH